jgi:UDP-glucuronate 4-epimerase
MQPGDVYQTYADTQDLFEATGYKPKVGVKEGVKEFVDWYKEFYN